MHGNTLGKTEQSELALGRLASDRRVFAGPPLAGRTSMADLCEPCAAFHFLTYAIQRPSGDQAGDHTDCSVHGPFVGPISSTVTSLCGVSPLIPPTKIS